MVLQFQPPNISPNAEQPWERSMGRLNDTFRNIGDQALRYKQQQVENARQKQLMDIANATNNRAQSIFLDEHGDPSAPAPSPMTGAAGQPNMSMADGSQGYNGVSSMASPTTPRMGGFPTVSPNFQDAQGNQSAQGAMPVDHTSHFQSWMAMGKPTNYDHPDYGGTGSGIGMSQNPMAQLQGQGRGAYNPDDPDNLGLSLRREGSLAYTRALQGKARAAGGRILATSPLAKTMFGNASEADLSMFGPEAPSILEKAAEMQASTNRFNTGLDATNQRQKNELLSKAQEDAGKNYGEFTKVDTDTSKAIEAMQGVSSNPATFTPALLKAAKAMGIPGRQPEVILKVMQDTNPSMASSINAYLSRKGQGQLPKELVNGITSILQNQADGNRQQFESNASAHAARVSGLYGDVNTAKQTLYPNYKWNAGGSSQGGEDRAGKGSFKTADDVRSAVLAGSLTRDQGLQVLRANFGYR